MMSILWVTDSDLDVRYPVVIIGDKAEAAALLADLKSSTPEEQRKKLAAVAPAAVTAKLWDTLDFEHEFDLTEVPAI